MTTNTETTKNTDPDPWRMNVVKAERQLLELRAALRAYLPAAEAIARGEVNCYFPPSIAKDWIASCVKLNDVLEGVIAGRLRYWV